MKRVVLALATVVLTASLINAQGKTAKPLQIWVVDVEGGKAARYVSPSGQTAMIDTFTATTLVTPSARSSCRVYDPRS
jgi:hypothetical protein